MSVSDKIALLEQKISIITCRGDLDKRRGVLRKLNRQLKALKTK